MAVNNVNINGFNILGNNTSPDQFGHFMRKVFNGNVAGLAVTQNSTPNMTVRVDEGVAILTKNTTSSVWGEVKTPTNVTIQTADTANPRIDTIIIYEDTSVSLPTATPYLTDGGGGRFKLASVSGVAAASPVALNDSAIQSQIGAGKPWARIADVTVPANTTTIINSNIADKRSYIGVGLNQLNGGTTAGVLATDASGNVTPAAYHKAGMWRSAAYTINGFTKITYDNVERNVGNAYSTSTGRFTVTQAGDYVVSMTAHASTASAEIFAVAIYKNGSLFKQGSQTKFTHSYTGTTLTTTVNLAVNDYLEFYAYASSAVAAQVGQAITYATVTQVP